jgi:CRISPR-associated protein (Cas_Cas5)
MVPRGEGARGQLSRWDELQAGDPVGQVTYRDYVVGGLYTFARWERLRSKVSLDQIMTALLQPAFAPFAGRAACSFALPFDPSIVETDGLIAAFAQRPLRPEIFELLGLKDQLAVEVAADEDGGLADGRIEQSMDGYAGLRAWSTRKQIVTEIANG